VYADNDKDAFGAPDTAKLVCPPVDSEGRPSGEVPRGFASNDPKEAAMLAFVKGTMDSEGHPPHHLLEEAREADWTDEQLLEALGEVALNEFQSYIANAAGLPQDQIDASVLPAAA